jgi:hypothetical protein
MQQRFIRPKGAFPLVLGTEAFALAVYPTAGITDRPIPVLKFQQRPLREFGYYYNQPRRGVTDTGIPPRHSLVGLGGSAITNIALISAMIGVDCGDNTRSSSSE